MKQLVVFCEGRSEQGFCNQVLRPHFLNSCQTDLQTYWVGRSGAGHVRGISKYSVLRKFIANILAGRKTADVIFTTMIDLYGLPAEFPGKSMATRNPAEPRPYVEALEHAFGADIADRRFLPYLQLHEFETLLYVDPHAFEFSVENCGDAIQRLVKIASDFGDVELINDDPLTAPSKRIIQILPEYAGLKATAGPDIAESIGLEKLRAHCPHFNAWITQLETRLREPPSTT